MIRVPAPEVKVSIGLLRDDLSHRVSDCGVGNSSQDRIEDVVAAVTTQSEDPDNFARAWQVLLRLAIDNCGPLLDAIENVRSWPTDQDELLPLFALVAHREPERVARLFPHVVGSNVVALCGQHGIKAALRELGSGEFDRRQEAAYALQAFAVAGIEVPSEPLVDALSTEPNGDVVDSMQSALRAVRAVPPPREVTCYGRFTPRPECRGIEAATSKGRKPDGTVSRSVITRWAKEKEGVAKKSRAKKARKGSKARSAK